MGEVFMGGLQPPSWTFLISDFVLQDTRKIFCQCYQNYLRRVWLKMFISKTSEGGFLGTPKILRCFSDILVRGLINGISIYGGFTFPLCTFLISNFVLQNTKKIFYQYYQHYLRRLYLNFRVEGGFCSTPKIPRCFFRHIGHGK